MSKTDKVHEGSQLRKYIRSTGATQEEFAAKLNMTRQNLNYHLQKEKLDSAFKDILEKRNPEGYRELFSKKKAAMANEGTPVYDLVATASQNENVNQLPETPAFRVSIPGYQDCNFGMYVYGHSMYPTIETGSLVLTRRVTDKRVVMYGEIYLIKTEDYLM